MAERAQLEQERLARLKRLRGETDSHFTGPPSKRRELSGETSSTPVFEVGPSRGKKEDEAVGQEAEVFWDGELRQTANMHVEPGHNGTNGKPVFRLSEIIGDVRLFCYLLVPPFCSC